MKMFGLAAIAAVAAMAFVGASTASATFNTLLCNEHTELICKTNPTEKIHMVNTEPGKLLSSLSTVLCLTILGESKLTQTLGTAPAGQLIETESLAYENCGTNSTHTNCTVKVNQKPMFNVLKLGLDEGTLKATNGLTRVTCENILGFIDIDCEYDTTGILFKVGAQHLTASKTPVSFVEGEGPCPESSTLDGLLETLSTTRTYILS